jgi:hypothetical protein
MIGGGSGATAACCHGAGGGSTTGSVIGETAVVSAMTGGGSGTFSTGGRRLRAHRLCGDHLLWRRFRWRRLRRNDAHHDRLDLGKRAMHGRSLQERRDHHDMDQNRECDSGVAGARVARRVNRVRAPRRDDQETADAEWYGRQPWTTYDYVRWLAKAGRDGRWLALDFKPLREKQTP